MRLSTRAAAKINLNLHVLGRRADGYHDLESLVVFAGLSDDLTLDPSAVEGLTVEGPTAIDSGAGPDNLVLRAAHHFRSGTHTARSGAFHLEKRLPVAAGLGGGSADAAAALRLLAALNGLDLDAPRVIEAARAAGADVPVCLESLPRVMGGIGHDLSPPIAMPPLPAILVNPRRGVATAPVFKALGLEPGERGHGEPMGPLPATLDRATLIERLRGWRNDLQAPAIAIEPAIAEVIDALEAIEGVLLARMSGSGATCFALFESEEQAGAAATALRRAYPDWWIEPTLLGAGPTAVDRTDI